MEPASTVETTNNLWVIIMNSGIVGIIAIPASILAVLGSIIGLILNKNRTELYLWILQATIKFNLLSGGLILALGITKFGLVMILDGGVPVGMADFFLMAICELMGGVCLLLLISVFAFIAETLIEFRLKTNAGRRGDFTVDRPVE